MGVNTRMNRSRVPVVLRDLVPSVEKWGRLDEAERLGLEESADSDPRVMAEVRRSAAKWKQRHFDAFDLWEDRTPGKASFEYFKFFYARILISDLEAWPKSAKKIDRVGRHIAELKRHGSYRLASNRMWAARLLPDYGPDAGRAIRELRKCLVDEDFRVRVWSHFALALIEGNVSDHRKQIECIRRRRIPEASDPKIGKTLDEGRNEAREALAELRRTPAERDRAALCGAAIEGDVENAKRLLNRVNVNAPDRDGAFAIEFAAGNEHMELTALLLKHGADPNVKLKVSVL